MQSNNFLKNLTDIFLPSKITLQLNKSILEVPVWVNSVKAIKIRLAFVVIASSVYGVHQ